MFLQLTYLFSRTRSKQGSALLIILGFVTLLTVLVVSLLLTTRFERSASSLALGRAQADVLADYGADAAIERLREAIDEGRQFNSNRYTTWASEPGRIHVFTISQTDGSITRVARDMFSAPPGPDADSANVDLNKAGLSGNHPITGTAPGVMKVGWLPVLADPGQPASKSNPAVGRVAYWVDDDSCKVNINTADGSKKVTFNSDGSVKSGDITKSFGFGVPSEISLQALGLTNAAAAAIADYAAASGFNSAAEINRIAGVPPSFYEDNKFNINHTARTPELNMFGELKIYLFPVQQISGVPRNLMVGGYGDYGSQIASSASTTVLSAITGPIDFIYPTSSMAPTLTATSNAQNQLPTMAAFTIPGRSPAAITLPLPQCLFSWSNQSAQGTNFNSALTNYPLGTRIARYLQGYNSQNQPIRWPAFSGATVNGFAGKYSPRQINSITLQILDTVSGMDTMADQGRLYTRSSNLVRGFLPDPGGDPVNPNDQDPVSIAFGVGHCPKLTELRIVVETLNPADVFGNGNPVASIKFQVMLETYMPKYYSGVPLDYYYSSISDLQFSTFGGNTSPMSLNQADVCYYNGGNGYLYPPTDPNYVPPTSIETSPPSSMNTWWMNEMLQINDQSNSYAGVDLMGWPAKKFVVSGATTAADKQRGFFGSLDPALQGSPSLPGTYHNPVCLIPTLLPPRDNVNDPDPNAGNISGSSLAGYKCDWNPTWPDPFKNASTWIAPIRSPLLLMTGPGASNLSWSPGTYHVSPNYYRQNARISKPDVTTFHLKGGLAIWTRDGSGSAFWDIAPLDSMRGGLWTGEVPSIPIAGSVEKRSGTIPNSLKPFVKSAVLPVDFNVPVPDPGVAYSLQVADPLVNKFPKDWQAFTFDNPNDPQITLVDPNSGNSTARCYSKLGGQENPDFPRSNNPGTVAGGDPTPQGHLLPINFNGDNPSFRPGGGGDPLSVWLPRQDIRYPKPSRFPSIGALNFIRTGVIPDDTTVDISLQHGTPWRSINFDKLDNTSPPSQQATLKGSYPDWAMLDLFTVPVIQQAPYRVDTSGNPIGTVPPIRKLTSGGSTEGRLNINNPAVPYPFSETYSGVTQTPPQRTLPLQALFYGLALSNSYDSSDNPNYSPVDAGALAAGVQNFLATSGPFMVPGQLANVPEISNYTYAGVAANARSRNDLMKSVIGATTTQSNTFSIWVVTQTFKKNPRNTDYSKFEPGDIVTGEVRKRYIVERFIEPGKDGVPGNASGSGGADGVVGTADDTVDAKYHPPMTYPLPYRWRIVSTEDVNL